MGCGLDSQQHVGNDGVHIEQGVRGELSDQSGSSGEGTERILEWLDLMILKGLSPPELFHDYQYNSQRELREVVEKLPGDNFWRDQELNLPSQGRGFNPTNRKSTKKCSLLGLDPKSCGLGWEATETEQ